MQPSPFRVLRQTTGPEERCPYLPGERSTTRYRLVDDPSAEWVVAMLERGWRRFGPVFFRPVCADCAACRSLRVDVDRFRPGRSQRRNLRRNTDLESRLRRPTASRDHLLLYRRYHHAMAERKGWPEKSETPLDYYVTFVEGRGTFGHEIAYYLGRDLVCVSLVDILPTAVSAVYTYYDPDLRHRGLGVHAVLRLIELARERGVPHLYLGYWVEGNASMRYKARYRPHEILQGRPEDDEAPEWSDTDQDEGLL